MRAFVASRDRVFYALIACYGAPVGTFNVAVQIGDLSGERWEWLEALVDTSASYSVVPRPLLEQLGVRPTRTIPLILTNGRRIERDLGEARLRYADLEVTTIVIFGEESTGPILGAYSLEGLGLTVDPTNQRLIPMTGLLM